MFLLLVMLMVVYMSKYDDGKCEDKLTGKSKNQSNRCHQLKMVFKILIKRKTQKGRGRKC